MTLRRASIKVADRVFGAGLVKAQKLREGASIVLYHRVSPVPDDTYAPLAPDEFDAHCELLKRSFSVIGLPELIDRRRRGLPLGGCCAITFDDGYLDFVDHAYPVLARHGLPATHFLVLDSVISGRPNWNWRTNRIVDRAKTWPDLPADLARLRSTTGLALADEVGRWDRHRREEWLLGCEEQLHLELETEPAMLRAGDLKRCGPSITWGSHTMSHAMLGWCGPDELRLELAGSRDTLHDLTDAAVDILSYPNGHFTDAVSAAAGAAGYGAAVAVGQHEVGRRSPIMALPRFDIGWMEAGRVRFEVGGAMQPLRNFRARVRGLSPTKGQAR